MSGCFGNPFSRKSSGIWTQPKKVVLLFGFFITPRKKGVPPRKKQKQQQKCGSPGPCPLPERKKKETRKDRPKWKSTASSDPPHPPLEALWSHRVGGEAAAEDQHATRPLRSQTRAKKVVFWFLCGFFPEIPR